MRCSDSLLPPYYRCESCGRGERVQRLTNGTGHCVDVDECTLYEPCDPRSTCVNQMPGYSCESCPSGYGGVHALGYYASYWNATNQKQKCEDIDECRKDTLQQKCSKNAICLNTIVSWLRKCALIALSLNVTIHPSFHNHFDSFSVFFFQPSPFPSPSIIEINSEMMWEIRAAMSVFVVEATRRKDWAASVSQMCSIVALRPPCVMSMPSVRIW